MSWICEHRACVLFIASELIPAITGFRYLGVSHLVFEMLRLSIKTIFRRK